MRLFVLSLVVVSLTLSSTLAQPASRPPVWGQEARWQVQGPDPEQVPGIIETLNEEAEKQYGKTFIVKYQLDLGPLNRVNANPELWKNLSAHQKQELGNQFAKAFSGSGLLFARFIVGDATVGKIRSDTVRGGLKYEPAKQP